MPQQIRRWLIVATAMTHLHLWSSDQVMAESKTGAPEVALPAIHDGLQNPHDAHTIDRCMTSHGWNMLCLRQQYGRTPAKWPAPNIDAGVEWMELQPIPDHEEPAPVAALGKKLFFDTRLSNKKRISCASCHAPDKGFTDGRPLAIGEDDLMGRRRTQPLFSAITATRFFWDGRASSLEEQVLHPIADPREMNLPIAQALARLSTLPDYVVPVKRAFGHDTMSAEQLAQALASFVRTLRPTPTAYDRFLSGDSSSLNDQQLLGMHLFRTKARCMNCHSGPWLTDQKFHNINLSFFGRRNQDLGRFEITRNPQDMGAFRTPSLRNVQRTGPWMHNGIFPSLTGIVRMYNQAMGNTPATRLPLTGTSPKKSALLQPLNLSAAEMAALVAFLETL